MVLPVRVEGSGASDSSVALFGFGWRTDPELIEGVVRAGAGPTGAAGIGDYDPTVPTAIDRHRRAVDVDLVGCWSVPPPSTRTSGLLLFVPSAAVERLGSTVLPALFGRRCVSTPAREFVHGWPHPRREGTGPLPWACLFEAATDV